MNFIGITWQLSSVTGWGIYGFNLTLELLNQGRYRPCLLREPFNFFPDPLQKTRLAPILEESKPYRQHNALPFPVFHGHGNDFVRIEQIVGTKNVGFYFIENTIFTEAGLERARQMDVLVAGSTWNAQILADRKLPPIIVSPQGVDLGLFHPAPVSKTIPDRFVVFSGGKLEYRKGQDLVVAAFRAFHQKHKDALLVVAWFNLWPPTALEITTSGLVSGIPTQDAKGRWDFRTWLLANGLPEGSFLDIGIVPNHMMPYIMRQADVAMYPNRCEGGTNLIAMETLACGTPCIISRNTGHLDIIGPDCLVLTQQGPCKPTPSFPGVEGWGESSVDEILAHLEWAYDHPQELAARGAAAAERMKAFAWPKMVTRLMEQLRL